MADNVTFQTTVATPPDATVVATDDVAGAHFQKVKLVDGTADSTAVIPGDATNGLDVDVTRVQGTVAISAASLPLPTGAATSAAQLPDGHNVTVDNASGASAVNIQDGGNSITVDGTVTVTEPVSVDDNAGSLTVDNPTLSVVGGGTEATALRVTIASDSTGVLSVDDNAGSLTVDGTVTVTATDLDIRNLDVAQDDVRVGGMAAADAAVADNPVAVGGRASTAIPTAMSADGDAVFAWLNRQGLQMVSMAPHLGLFGSQPWNLTSETAQYTTTQTSTVLVAGGASERIVVTAIQIQVGGTTAGTLQVYFGTGAYSRGTNLAIFDGEFAPSATLKPGVVMQGPFISATNGDDLLVTTSAAINPLTITVWYYVVV